MLKALEMSGRSAERATELGLLLANGFGVVLNQALEVLLRVPVRLKDDDVTFWEEIPQEKAVDAGEHGQGVQGVDVFALVKRGRGGKDDPGEDQQEQAEGYGFGLVVILREVFPHVGESEAQHAQQ